MPVTLPRWAAMRRALWGAWFRTPQRPGRPRSTTGSSSTAIGARWGGTPVDRQRASAVQARADVVLAQQGECNQPPTVQPVPTSPLMPVITDHPHA